MLWHNDVHFCYNTSYHYYVSTSYYVSILHYVISLSYACGSEGVQRVIYVIYTYICIIPMLYYIMLYSMCYVIYIYIYVLYMPMLYYL